ncbi:hypothetical protein HMPREF9597_00502 [Cutibacterium acnes HL005PA4]|nr:hypothetical protein HMPREF9575_01578 [Cutibacterium acnes HL110PA1]EFS59256.1 hypothetical protein HMPREF9604_00866 [Cutibacterium acnes HL036PA1]EFS66891.1 hypothetical protein HMPREF9612_00792 [Cutibacterium acnes HL063PA2]EFS80033.1 hypothetical protein HMPREF9597_00502 [Cutibacterium acnes HL005PA4]EFS81300.1 hypothetical protein HMPREF9598_02005 [Cutibacterium acnes HL050PA1]EFT07985.1 hypothetical protein HMPREF9618_00851 [Cutibacterium acnes HL082PA1]EFT21694.1 hypothetical protein
MQQDVTIDDERQKTVSVIRRSLVRSRTRRHLVGNFPIAPPALTCHGCCLAPV